MLGLAGGGGLTTGLEVMGGLEVRDQGSPSELDARGTRSRNSGLLCVAGVVLPVLIVGSKSASARRRTPSMPRRPTARPRAPRRAHRSAGWTCAPNRLSYSASATCARAAPGKPSARCAGGAPGPWQLGELVRTLDRPSRGGRRPDGRRSAGSAPGPAGLAHSAGGEGARARRWPARVGQTCACPARGSPQKQSALDISLRGLTPLSVGDALREKVCRAPQPIASRSLRRARYTRPSTVVTGSPVSLAISGTVRSAP